MFADWSGTDTLGALTSDSYGYDASFTAWGDFSFSIDRLGPGEYELVFVNSTASEGSAGFIALVAPFTIAGN